MADGFLSDLLKGASKGDEEARETLKDIKRKLDGLNMSPKKKANIDHAVPSTSCENIPQKDYRCEICDKEFTKRNSYQRHMKEHTVSMQ